jgi:hypothetical protein
MESKNDDAVNNRFLWGLCRVTWKFGGLKVASLKTMPRAPFFRSSNKTFQ